MIFQNPIRQAVIRPPSAPRIIGNFRVTQRFGCTGVIQERALGDCAHFHRGIDLGNGQCGADVLAARAGTVKYSGKPISGGGEEIWISHGNGWFTLYAHMSRRLVSAGDTVTAGHHIGVMGDTGVSTGCHLHFGVKSGASGALNLWSDTNGKYIDAWPLLAQNVTVWPNDVGVNIRLTAGSGVIPGALFATTRGDRIIRESDKVDLGASATKRKWGGTVKGATWRVGEESGNAWERIYLGGTYRYLAAPLAGRSAR